MINQDKKTKVEEKKIDVMLEKQHTHGGKNYGAGAVIKVKPRQAKWLAERKIIATAAN